jgi:TonB family protein
MLALAFLVMAAAGQPQRPPSQIDPLPKGQRLEAKDGDTVVISGNARVRIVHRTQGTVRAIYNGAERWLVLLIDYADPRQGAPDGAVDATRTFQHLDGVWPLGERWEGSAVLDDYSMLNTPGGSLGITTDAGVIQLISGSPATNTRLFVDERAVALRYNGGNIANALPTGPRQSFDEIETRAVAEATRGAATRSGISQFPFDGPSGARFTTRVDMGGAAAVAAPNPSSPLAPVRVGGNIPQPRKIADARPVLPAEAAQAGIRGVVIVEIVVGVDGSVSDAKILRSIPTLDGAALDTVRHWRYEPTALNGQPVPVIMTVTVAFQ